MEAFQYMRDIHFASLFFIGMSAGVTFVILAIFWLLWKPHVLSYDFIAFFWVKSERPLGLRRLPYQFYRVLPYGILVLLVLAAGNPIHEKTETISEKKTPYIVILDTSGSTKDANAFKEGVVASFDETALNAFRTALMRFVGEEKDRAEFFLVLYSDIPYAARFFAGGKEAEGQIIKFLEDLPKELRKRRDSSQTFYFQGTHTAFAIEAAARYRAILPEIYSQSVFLVLTDFEDPDVVKTAQAVNALTDSGLTRSIYFVILSGGVTGGKTLLGSFERALTYREKVRIYSAESEVGLHTAFRAIAEAERPYAEIKREVVSSKSLQAFLLYGALMGALIFVLLAEIQFRKMP